MRWLVLGYGDIVVRRAVPALLALGHDVLLWGRRPLRAVETAALLGVTATDDLRSALRLVSLVYVATPVAGHLPLARLAVAAGRPVLIEKPVAGTLADRARVLPELACGVVGVAYYRRLSPAVRRLRAAVRDDPPVSASVRFAAAFEPAPEDPKYWRTDVSIAGGGVLADAGSHRIDLLCLLFGPPTQVRATLAARHPGGAERSARVTLTWPDGRTADVTCDWRPADPVDSFEVRTATRTLRLDPLDGGRLAGEGNGDLLTPPAANPHLPLFADFTDAVRGGQPPVCPLAEALTVDRILAAAERSQGRTVSL
jgi:predicted dehydrogenase